MSDCRSETASSLTGVDLMVHAAKRYASMADDVRRHGNKQSATVPMTTQDSSVKRVSNIVVLSCVLYCSWQTLLKHKCKLAFSLSYSVMS